MTSFENPNFLKQKYKDLNKSKEVESAASRTEARNDNDKELPMTEADDRIQNYLNRLKEIFENPDAEKRERGIEFLKHKLYDQFVIKPEEIPKAYFESIKLKHRNEGHGDIEIPEDYRQELSETIIDDQTHSLDNWIDYLSSDDAKYPDWFKYYIVRNILHMGRYDKNKKSFTERTGGTIAPFPDLNRDALAIVFDSFELQAKGEQVKFGYDIHENTKKQYLEALERKNFAKLYALVIEEFKPISEELLQIIEGEWRTYPRGSNPKLLVEAIAPYGTGWCLRGESMAERYLVRDKNELQIFYSLDKEGKATVPRVVTVVNDNNQLTEVRGVAKEENLDQYIGPVVETKLKEFPDGEAYKKKSSDMKLLTLIESKTKQNLPLDKKELIFLYEIDLTIEGFGYQKDPRIAELREQRKNNLDQDMLVVFECNKDQIAHNSNEITENTKAYVGKLEDDIFHKLPEKIEYLYTSFPEGRLTKFEALMGDKTKEEIINEIDQRKNSEGDDKIFTTSDADFMSKHRDFQVLEKSEIIKYLRFKVKDLGFTTSATTEEIFNKAQKLGLELCPAETGHRLRLDYKKIFKREQPKNDYFRIGMNPIVDSAGYLSVFDVFRDVGGKSWLADYYAKPDDKWFPGTEFVFRLSSRKLES